jgi:transglutaminase-like putative cysteine protease
MSTLNPGLNIAQLLLSAVIALAAGLMLYAMPASLSLPRGRRPGLERLSLAQAARQLRDSGLGGWTLAEAARALVAERMQYCRRNSFDGYRKAFERGYGYCQQQAYALADLLGQLGFEASVVHALRNHLPDGRETAHAWVRVTLDGRMHDLCAIYYDPQAGAITFTPLTEVRAYTPVFRLLAAWGSAAVNAHRYYVSGVDH